VGRSRSAFGNTWRFKPKVVYLIYTQIFGKKISIEEKKEMYQIMIRITIIFKNLFLS
jgi:hypothetical protein